MERASQGNGNRSFYHQAFPPDLDAFALTP